MYLIYALVDPRTGERFYIGQSSKGLERPRQHLKPSSLNGPSRKAAYIRALLSDGLKPSIDVLERIDRPDDILPPPLQCWTGEDVDALSAREMWWIHHGRAAGWPLTNGTTGGDGVRGAVVSDAHRVNMSNAAKGRSKAPFTAEHRANMSAAAKGKKKSPEHVAKVAATRTGSKMHPATRAAIAAANIGRECTEETREKIRTALRANPAAIAQRATLRRLKIGRKRPPMTEATKAKFLRLSEQRRGVPAPFGHGGKIRAAKRLTSIGRSFALLLAGLATIS